jgi:hypothetical protein
VGNAICFGVERLLPPWAQHQLYQIDWGLAVDLWICLTCYLIPAHSPLRNVGQEANWQPSETILIS